MVISFAKMAPFTQLRDHGYVISFRPDERDRTPRDGVQKTWCNRGRGTTKEFDVFVTHLAEKEPGDDYFTVYQQHSGFNTKGDWLAEVLWMHGEVPPTGHFSLVNRTDHAPDLEP